MEDKKVLLSVRDLVVKFHVRGRILTAIRGISLDIYENESIAIVGESGSGKSVFTKTFAGMLDSNGFVDSGSIIFNDDEISQTNAVKDEKALKTISQYKEKLDEYAKLKAGAQTYLEIEGLKKEIEDHKFISAEKKAEFDQSLFNLEHELTETRNYRQNLGKNDKEELKTVDEKIKTLEKEIKEVNEEIKKENKAALEFSKHDTAFNAEHQDKIKELTARYNKEIAGEVPAADLARNEVLAKEIYLSTARFGLRKRSKTVKGLLESFKKAMTLGLDLDDENTLNGVFENATLRVKYIEETDDQFKGYAVNNIAKLDDEHDWSMIRGSRIATVFQDPMTSLNPIITIGKQITSVILKHQNVSEVEARRQAIELMNKVGIPNAEQRFDDYPFQYSGGMRQRIVIAIALSCHPKILICDEPTTALDVTIQAQILKLIKQLQKEFKYTIVFITHDLGVVANIADRVAVLYAGQIIELGSVEDIFYDPRHPYTWALLSSLPQLAQRNTKLYSITGTPPSLYNNIVGDAFAPRNPYCLLIDTLEEPELKQVSETHWAKTWLLDERAPKIEKPEIIHNIHEKLIKGFNIQES
ncbi:MAG: ATP-binding cassette domain-containing protein [Erysipelotrichaceae bacterium]|nr:ATP-binding cassette domain-containing protein [Erysipelotrichaceae bacterium]